VSGGVVIGDWGSTRLRLWRIEHGEAVERREGPGMAQAVDPGATLLATMGDWAADRIVLGGMAGARGGLHEVPYLDCPVSSGEWAAAASRHEFAGVQLTLAAGLSCRALNGRADVMRGEEVQAFGAMALDPKLAAGIHWMVLPGTHSKWVRLNDGSLTSFRTFMTGELFALLDGSSLKLADAPRGDDDAEGFTEGVGRALDGGGLSGNLFEARSAQLVDGRSASWARGLISGLLIGAEIAEMAPQGPVAVIGESRLTARYAEALASRGVAANCAGGEACAIAGLGLLDEN
jgi:2-dehydro-3-deoxygalactonokinase